MKREYSLQELQQKETEILSFFHEFCTEHGIPYFLAYGTMIGAVRHGGFIPWDDDIDVFMRRADYERLLRILPETKCEHYSLQTIYNDRSYSNAFAKLVDTRVPLYSTVSGEPQGFCWIDIFPLDCIPRNRFLRKLYSKLLQYLFKRKKKADSSRKNAVCRVFDSACQMFNVFHCKYVADCVFNGRIKNVIPAEYLEDRMMIEFGKKQFSIYGNYDDILRSGYGDYMTPPPVEDQVPSHSFVAYHEE